MPTIEKNTALKLLKGFVIPPRPDILTRFHQEQNKPNPSMKRVADIVSSDPGISASVIKTVNSPYFGLSRKTSSIHDAVSLIGTANLDNIVTSLALIAASSTQVNMERFWDTAMDVALISKNLARYVMGISEAEAFTLGIFHDCGIALMMKHTPDYKQLLAQANTDTARSLPELEQEHYQTDHTTIGFLIAKAWNLPDHLCEAIQLHHNRAIFEQEKTYAEGVLPLIAILKVASYLSHSIRCLQDSNDWSFMRQPVLSYLGISDEELDEIECEIRQNSSSTPQVWISKFEDSHS